MHRLFTLSVIIVSTLLLSMSAEAKSTPKLQEAIADGTHSAAVQQRLRTARSVEAQWQPGLVSRNVRIVRMSKARAPRTGDSFSFGVEREMKESGEKGGTEDINIGVGELQECTISKSMDSASSFLARVAGSRQRLPMIVLRGRDSSGKTFMIKMKNVYISSYQTGGSSAGRARTETLTIQYTGLE
jgi:type VI protein secretion system component Hcp